MGLVYLFALVLGLGILLVQLAFGGKGGDGGEGAEGETEGDLDKNVGGEGAEAFVALFLSTRFWIFFSLAFGLSGSLFHYLDLAGTALGLALAAGSGISAGLFAVLLFRAVKRASVSTHTGASEAVGQIGRVLVPCAPGKLGKIRVELGGNSLDMLASTAEAAGIGRGDRVLVEDVVDSVAHVSRGPKELL